MNQTAVTQTLKQGSGEAYPTLNPPISSILHTHPQPEVDEYSNPANLQTTNTLFQVKVLLSKSHLRKSINVKKDFEYQKEKYAWRVITSRLDLLKVAFIEFMYTVKQGTCENKKSRKYM